MKCTEDLVQRFFRRILKLVADTHNESRISKSCNLHVRKDRQACREVQPDVRNSAKPESPASALFGRNGIPNILDVLLYLAHLRMHLTDQVVLHFRKLFYACRHFMQLFQHCILARRDTMHPPKTNAPTTNTEPAKHNRDHITVPASLRFQC